MVTRDEVIKALEGIIDPELNIDIWTLELIRDISIENSIVKIKMTLTTPTCPYGPAILEGVESAIKDLGVEKVDIELEFSPPWQPSGLVKEMLGLT